MFSSEEEALLKDISNLEWAISRVQVAIVNTPPVTEPRRVLPGDATLGLDTLGLAESQQEQGTQRSLGDIDAAMRAQGCRRAAVASSLHTCMRHSQQSLCHSIIFCA